MLLDCFDWLPSGGEAIDAVDEVELEEVEVLQQGAEQQLLPQFHQT